MHSTEKCNEHKNLCFQTFDMQELRLCKEVSCLKINIKCVKWAILTNNVVVAETVKGGCINDYNLGGTELGMWKGFIWRMPVCGNMQFASTDCSYTQYLCFYSKGALRKLPAFVHRLNKKRTEVCEKITVHCHLLVTATSHFLAQSPLHHPAPSPVTVLPTPAWALFQFCRRK